MPPVKDSIIQLSPAIPPVVYSATAETIDRRDNLILDASRIEEVTNTETAQAAGAVIKSLKEFASGIEVARKTFKAPVIKLGNQIDALADELTADVLAESKRIGALIGPYQAQQQKLAQEARQRAWEEEQRIKREADDRQRVIDEKAAADLKAANEKAARARTETGKAKALEEAAQIQKNAEAASQEAQNQAAQQVATTRESVALATPGKIAGVSNRVSYKFEVTDIEALYQANPFFVKMEANTASITAALKQLRDDQTIPGLKWWKESGVAVRA